MKLLRFLLLAISFMGSISTTTTAHAQLTVHEPQQVTETSARILWATVGQQQLNFTVNIAQFGGGGAGNGTTINFAGPADKTVGGTRTYSVLSSMKGFVLTPQTRYQVTVTAVGSNLTDTRIFSTLGGAAAIGGLGDGGFFGGGGFAGGYTDPLAARLEGAGKYMEGAGKLIESEGKFLKLQAEARKTIAEAVDLELDNWKKHVAVYFDRRELNETGKMRLRDLYDIRQDQTLHFKDTAARRRYEYIARHSGTSGGDVKNLGFLNELFVGTPLGYGASLDELFGANGPTDRWRLTPEMLHHLRVRSRNSNGVWMEFRLDTPNASAMEMEWPVFFRQTDFDDIRSKIESLNEAIVHESNPTAQLQMAAELSDAFAALAQDFFRFFGKSPDRGRLHRMEPDKYRQLARAEDFLHQKKREIEALVENPQAVLGITSNFIPDIHGRDAGTLIAWMNSRGMTFAKPKVGEEAAYQKLYTMMHELYALSGAPILEVPQTEAPPVVVINEAGSDDGGEGGFGQLGPPIEVE